MNVDIQKQLKEHSPYTQWDKREMHSSSTNYLWVRTVSEKLRSGLLDFICNNLSVSPLKFKRKLFASLRQFYNNYFWNGWQFYELEFMWQKQIRDAILEQNPSIIRMCCAHWNMINNKIKVQIVWCVCVCCFCPQSSQDEQGEGKKGGGGVGGREVMAPSCGQSWLLLPRSWWGTLVVLE